MLATYPQEHGVTRCPDDDRNGARCVHRRARGGGGVRHDHLNRDSDKLRSKTRQCIDIPVSETEIENDSFSVDVAEIAKSLAESVEVGRRVVRGNTVF